MKNKSALVVIDFINEIVHVEGQVAKGGNAKFIAEHQVIQHANQAIAIARDAKIPIIFVKVGFSKGYPECPIHSPIFGSAKQNNLFQLNTWSTEYHPDLDFRPGDISIVKRRVSAFYNTDLEAILRAQGIDTVILCGVSTAMAIDHTARDAHDRDYNVIVLKDACAAMDQTHHDAALLVINRLGKIIQTQDFAGALS